MSEDTGTLGLGIPVTGTEWGPDEFKEWAFMGHIVRQYGPDEYGWELQETWFAEDGSDQKELQLAGRGFLEGDMLYLSPWRIRHKATQESIRQFDAHRDSLPEWGGTKYVVWLLGPDKARVFGPQKDGGVPWAEVSDDVAAEVRPVMARVPFLAHIEDDGSLRLPEY